MAVCACVGVSPVRGCCWRQRLVCGHLCTHSCGHVSVLRACIWDTHRVYFGPFGLIFGQLSHLPAQHTELCESYTSAHKFPISVFWELGNA